MIVPVVESTTEKHQTRRDQATPTTAAVFTLAWPLAVNTILLYSIVITDTILVSVIGEEALAAMGLAAAFAGLLLGAIAALSQATQILVAQAQGANNTVALKSAFWCGLFISTAATGIGLCFVWTVGDNVILNFAHTPGIAEEALAYLHIFVLVIICEAGSLTISCHFNGTGRTRLPFYSHSAAMPVNIGLSILLIFGLYGFPELGLSGAAIGSAAAAVLRLLLLIHYLQRLDSAKLGAQGWAQVTFIRSIKHHFVFALPVAGTFFGQAVASAACALLYARMSINQFAAMTLIMPWMQVVGTLMISWAQATGIFVGQLLGRQIPDEALNEFLARAWRIAFALAALVSVLYLTASISFRYIYVDLQAETTDALWSFVPALLLLTFPKSSNAICGNALRAGGDTVYVMNIHLVSQWAFRVPLTALFVLYLESSVAWVFALFLIEEILKFPIFHLRFYAGKWRQSLGCNGAGDRAEPRRR